jgi:hypothetical protein
MPVANANWDRILFISKRKKHLGSKPFKGEDNWLKQYGGEYWRRAGLPICSSKI